jgi:hypothetical protein
MLNIIDQYWQLPAPQRTLYRLGRRLGYFSRLNDLSDPVRSRHVAQVCQENSITPDNADAFTLELLRRYI